MSLRIWASLPERYRASEDPDALISLFRGDFIGREVTGITCSLESSLDPEELVFRSLFQKYPSIGTLVKRHTQNNHNSPFISLTDQYNLAKSFATCSNETVYGILLPAHCLVLDEPRAGESSYVEALAIGSIEPDSISVIVNDTNR